MKQEGEVTEVQETKFSKDGKLYNTWLNYCAKGFIGKAINILLLICIPGYISTLLIVSLKITFISFKYLLKINII